MTRRRPLAGLLAMLLAAGAATAERRPEPGPGDPRVQSVLYDPQDVVLIEAVTNYQVTVQFAPDERIENVAVGNSGAWQVTPNKRGDNLFVKPLQQGAPTNMTVVTDAHVYNFALATAYGPSPSMPFIVRFRYPPPATAKIVATADRPALVVSRWKLGGAAAIRPKRIEDDGTHITIAWAADAALPAVFSVDTEGRESLVNGMMRDRVFVIDGLTDRLVFRLNNLSASARRVTKRVRK